MIDKKLKLESDMKLLLNVTDWYIRLEQITKGDSSEVHDIVITIDPIYKSRFDSDFEAKIGQVLKRNGIIPSSYRFIDQRPIESSIVGLVY